MSGSIVIAEMNDGKVSATTAELVSAALAYGSNPTLVIPCTSPSVADGEGYEGVTQVVACVASIFSSFDAAGWAEALDGVTSEGSIFVSASPHSKDLAARLASRKGIPVVQDVKMKREIDKSGLFRESKIKQYLYQEMLRSASVRIFSKEQIQYL